MKKMKNLMKFLKFEIKNRENSSICDRQYCLKL